MNRFSFPKLRSGAWQFLLVILLSAWCLPMKANTINTINIDSFNQFLLLDNTLLLNAGEFPTSGVRSVRLASGREQIIRNRIRVLGARSDFGREMIRMGREFSVFLRGRAIPRTTYNPFLLRADNTTRLRSNLLSKSRQLTGRYSLGRLGRTIDGKRETLDLFANFSIFGDDLVWTVTDNSGDKVFAMSNYKSVPEPGGLLLLMSGLIGLALVIFIRPGGHRRSAS